MKWKIGAALMACVFCLAILPPLISGAQAGEADVFAGFGGKSAHEVVLQQGNARAVADGEQVLLGDEPGAAVYRSEQGDIMVPVRGLAETMELVMDWDNPSQTVSLTSGKSKIEISVGAAVVTGGAKAIAVSTPAVNREGTLFVPAKAVAQAFEWGYAETEADDLIFFSGKTAQIKDNAIKKLGQRATEMLGQPLRKLLADTIIFRAGSDAVIKNGEQTDLADADGVFYAPLMQGDIAYLPARAVAAALGGKGETLDNDGIKMTLGKNVIELMPDGSVLQNGKKYKNAKAEDVLVQDDVLYVSAELLRAMTEGFAHYKDDVWLIGSIDFARADSQIASMCEMGAALPDSRRAIPKADAYVALTFDDGPTGGASGVTARLLDGLYERGAHATFFMCGYRVKDFHTHMDRYLAEGHEIANHTMDHPGVLTRKDYATIVQQINSNNELIESYCGEEPTMFRPVGGAVNDNVKKAAKQAGLPVINWSVDTLDWKHRDAQNIKKIIVSQAKDGDIVLMHDLRDVTLNGALAAIDELQKKGYAFVTVSELARIKGVELEAGEVYTDLRDATVKQIKDGTYKANY